MHTCSQAVFLYKLVFSVNQCRVYQLLLAHLEPKLVELGFAGARADGEPGSEAYVVSDGGRELAEHAT